MRNLSPLIFLLLLSSFSFAFTNTTIIQGGINYTVLTYIASDTFVSPLNINAEVLVIGGGAGAGGAHYTPSGGGGAGGYLLNSSYALNVGQSYTVTIGGAGAGGTYGGGYATSLVGSSGGNSVFNNLTSIGGGGGAAYVGGLVAGNGGSGGGCTYGTGGGTGTAGQGYNGGSCTNNNAGGGGGGSSAVGGNNAGDNAGDGGAGTSLNITGTLTTYACGGGGAGTTYSGLGGCSSAGNGTLAGQGSAAIANSGSGGGGGWTSSGANGGSGIVIVRYATPTGGPPAATLTVTQGGPANATLTQNKSVVFNYSVNFTYFANVNVILYANNTVLANDTIATNTTFLVPFNATHGITSWYVFAYNSSNLGQNTTSPTHSFEVYFNTTATAPPNNALLSGTSITLAYATNNFYPVNCTTYIDGSSVNFQVVPVAATISITTNATDGTHSWLASCVAGDNPSYVKNVSTLSFSMNFASFNNVLALTSAQENVLASPQNIFYDINGNLNVLYFTSELDGSSTIRIKTIASNAVINAANLTFPATAQYFVLFRGASVSTILSLNETDTTNGFMFNLTGNSLTEAAIPFPYSGVLPLTQHDAYTYDSTQNFTSLALDASSFYLFTVPMANGSVVLNWNGSKFSPAASFPNSVKAQWQTVANDSALHAWYYLTPIDVGAGNSRIDLYSFNGTGSSFIATVDSGSYSAAALSGAIAGFESFGGKTYAYITNLSSTTIYNIEGNKSYEINSTLTNPSHFLFTDKNTFVFFSGSGASTLAFSCYFEGAPTCLNYSASDYGAAVPYERGFMSSAKRTSNNDDTVVRGKIQSGTVVSLYYNTNTYDMKFICYDEVNDARKLFVVRIITDTTATELKNDTWGYVLPSTSVGTGLKKYYSTCQNGTQRLFVSGLTGNFSADLYTLASNLGVIYSFNTKDRFGIAIANVKFSMLRFSTLKQAFVVVEQCLSDFNGNCAFFLEPNTPYKILIEASSYTAQLVDFTPSVVTQINVALDASGQSFALPSYNYIFSDITYSLSPSNTLMRNATTITFTVSSASSKLQYYGMDIYRTFNGTRTQVFLNNVTTQPTGGSLSYLVNLNGTYDVRLWVKHQDFAEFDPTAQSYTFQAESGISSAGKALQNPNSGFSAWAIYFFGVVVVMVVVGFVSKYTIDGAGIVGLFVLWGFTFLVPNGVLANFGGLAITTTMSSLVTTIVTVAALYLRYRASSGG
jgi:hypothetical protein